MSTRSSARSTFVGTYLLWILGFAVVAVGPQRSLATPALPGDFDGDGDVDLSDMESLADCFAGPFAPPDPTPPTTAAECLAAFDADGDGDIDFLDWSTFQVSFTGPVFELLIGPVEDLTTLWHPAPPETAAALGMTLQFEVTGVEPWVPVEWIGAVEVERGETYSRAESVLTEVGMHTVEVVVHAGQTLEWGSASQLDVLDIPAEDITCAVEVSVPPLLLDEESSNEETMAYFFPISSSIAKLTEVGPDHYRTSVAQEITFTVQTQPAGFEPLIEWRHDGQVLGFGQVLADHVIDLPGTYMFDVGSVVQPEQVQLDTYGVTITSHTSFVDIILEGEAVVFTAVTDPTGLEADITWLSSTLYGTASPVLGSGPSFTVQFDDTIGPENGFQWLGVRADNASFEQDQVICNCCLPPSGLTCPPADPVNLCMEMLTIDCEAMPGACCIDGPCPTEVQKVLTAAHGHMGGGSGGHCTVPVIKCEPCDPSPPCVDGEEKIDAFSTGIGDELNCHDFGNPGACPIPADFFGPGSDPFDSQVCFKGEPLGEVTLPGFPDPLDFGEADTLVRRGSDPFDRCELPSGDPVVVSIVMERLNLVSIDPITVTFNGGQNPEEWNVRMVVDESGPPQPAGGALTATKSDCNGGTFDSDFVVCPKFIFTKVDPPFMELSIDDVCEDCDPLTLVLTVDGIGWINDLAPGLGAENPVCTDFHPLIAEINPVTDCDCNGNGVRDKCDIEDGTSQDCNGNGIPDLCEVPPSSGCPTGLCVIDCLEDLNENCIPDECE